MKIKCEVIAVSGDGEVLHVKMQGSTAGAANWRRMGVCTIEIPETPKSQKTFHLGRIVTINIRTR